ncbi:MAG: hypothetical protein OEN23_14560 [Paracoccaceae bacterium]|nr:hypothetical protein [Paracoccaceae bacterium]
MRAAHILLISCLAFAPVGVPSLALAQSDELEPEVPLSENIERMFRELMDEVGPAIDELSEALSIFDEIDSLEHYEGPEIMPNGDIIIRRREDAPPYIPQTDDPGVRT